MSAVRRFSRRGVSLHSWVASLFSSSEASFSGRNIAGEDRVLLDARAADQERARAQGVSGSEGHGLWLQTCVVCAASSKIVIEVAEHGQLGDLLIVQFQRT